MRKKCHNYSSEENATIKGECIRPGVPLSFDDARTMVENFIVHYNNVRLHSAIGYVAPANKLNGREQAIFKERDRELEDARELRKVRRLQGPLRNPMLSQVNNSAPLESLLQMARLSISS